VHLLHVPSQLVRVGCAEVAEVTFEMPRLGGGFGGFFGGGGGEKYRGRSLVYTPVVSLHHVVSQ